MRVAAIAVSVLAAAGFAQSSGAAVIEPSIADREPLKVVATAYPLYEAAAAVGGSRVAATDIVPIDAFTDTPLSDEKRQEIIDADLVVAPGRGTQPQLADALAARTGQTLFVLDGLESQPAKAGMDGDADPYIWLDPRLLAHVTSQIQDRLSLIDPDAGQLYLERSSNYRAFLSGVDRDYAHAFAGCKSNALVVENQDFSYLADRYGLRQYLTSTTGDELPSGGLTLEEVQRTANPTTVFASELPPSREARDLYKETGLRVAVLDNLANRTDQARRGGADYERVMRLNLVALKEALGCTDAFGGL